MHRLAERTASDALASRGRSVGHCVARGASVAALGTHSRHGGAGVLVAAVGTMPAVPLKAARTTFGQLLQTGMSFIITRQVQPFFIIMVMQSQHDWIMAIMAASPLV